MESSSTSQVEVEALPKISLEDFQAEILGLTVREESGEEGTSDLTRHMGREQRIDVGSLTEKDAVMWEKIKNYPKYGEISGEEWSIHVRDVGASGNIYRAQFLGFLANRKGRKMLLKM